MTTNGVDERAVSRRGMLQAGIAVAAVLPAAAADAAQASGGVAPVSRTSPEALRVYKAIPQFRRLRDQVLFGDVWRQPEMSPRDRSIVTCAVLAALGRSDELVGHVRLAIDNGVTKDEIRGMAVQVAFYAGWPAGMSIGKAALPYLESGG